MLSMKASDCTGHDHGHGHGHGREHEGKQLHGMGGRERACARARTCFWYGRSCSVGNSPGGSGSSSGWTCSIALSSWSHDQRSTYRGVEVSAPLDDAAEGLIEPPFFCARRVRQYSDVCVALQCEVHSVQSEAGASQTSGREQWQARCVRSHADARRCQVAGLRGRRREGGAREAREAREQHGGL